ncbi:MAG: carbon-nitrogen hydrolase [Nitrospinae bacterium]|nr:carbon-nitrogen hydrolase [Nitrospinota bacterium]
MKLAIGLVQMAMGADPSDNLRKAVEQIGRAAQAKANVVCLPELFMTPYFCQKEDPANFDLAEPIPGPTTEKLGKISAREKITVVATIFEKRAPGLYHNTAVVIGPDGAIIGTYRKMHIPDDPSYFEKYYFTPGDLGYKAFPTPFGKIGVLVCWDQWYPEAARLTALKGANVIFYPTAIGWHPAEKESHGPGQLDAWRTVQRGHAVANGVFIAAANRVGFEKSENGDDGLDFWGSSFIADPFGKTLVSASGGAEETIVREIDLEQIENVRRQWPFLRDRRVDSYAQITDRYTEE